jgi:hypothetical protein
MYHSRLPSERRTLTLRDPVGDTSGAVLLMGIPMACILTGVIWHCMGVGDAILGAEALRLTADEAAFQGAVWHARGMNLLAILNLLMQALAVVNVAWDLLLTALPLVSLFCTSPDVSCPGDASDAAGQLAQQMSDGRQAEHDWLEQQLATIQRIEKYTSSVTPYIAAQHSILPDSPRSNGVRFAIAGALSMLSDDSIGGLSGHGGDIGKHPRLAVSTSFGALPVEGDDETNFCGRINPFVAGVAGQLLGAANATWAPAAFAATSIDLKQIVSQWPPLTACLGDDKAHPIQAAAIWYYADPKRFSKAEAGLIETEFTVFGFAFSDPSWGSGDDGGVMVAGHGSATPPSTTWRWTGSEAEFYFDCGGRKWKDCAGEALYAPKWSARLRRVRKPVGEDQNLTIAEYFSALPAAYQSFIPSQAVSVLSDAGAVEKRIGFLIH